ncbi:MAG TPA: LysR family transcriptional regulator [Nocardioides sp.]|uniref:LysR family transcriptional regulator n=1 Tax=Nocardioides sp. TaxID=35761 RepID=UPI002C53D77D|nr:LysR family transcriptional regulator [Nocardioides sp.]HTW15607.1 LysR family transcriptional regulator [Nocardioides sp.]
MEAKPFVPAGMTAQPLVTLHPGSSVQLRQVQYFVATADAGTVSAAAAAVHVTQPALSRQLRQLEVDLGVELFDRRAGRLLLSRSGRELLPVARRLLRAADGLRESARFLAGGRLAQVTIAAPTVTLTDVVAPFVATTSADDPVVDVQAADGLTTTEMLDNGADLAIGLQRPRAPYAVRALVELPVWAFVRADDPWSSRRAVTVAELAGRSLVCLPSSFTSRQALAAAAEREAVALGEVQEVATGTIAQALAAAGRGVCVVSDDPRFDLVPLAIDTRGTTLAVNLHVAWHARSAAAPALQSLAGRLSDFVRRQYARPNPHALAEGGT